MVAEAVVSLKERNGSSVQAIKKYIVTKYPDLVFAHHQLRSALKKGTAAEKLIKVGQRGHYVLLFVTLKQKLLL